MKSFSLLYSVILSVSATALAGAQTTLFSSDFTANTGASVLAGNADNTSGSETLLVTDWSKQPIVSTISNLTKINTNGGVDADGGFAQLQNGAAALANANTVFINENQNAGAAPRKRGFSFSFTLTDSYYPRTLSVLSGHASGAGTDQSSSSDLVYQLSGGSLSEPITASSTQNYGSAPAYHTVDFDLIGTTLSAGTYTLEVYQTNSTGGSYASFDSIALEGYAGTPPPTISSFSGTPTVIDSGESITLSWSVNGSSSVSIDQGIGSVAASGSLVLSPSDTTTYTLTALNGEVPSTASTTVTLRQDVDVYLFGGQSNMQGLGKLSELSEQQLTAPVNVFYWNHSEGSFEPYHPSTTVTASAGEFGPELAFAHAVSNPNRKSYIVKYAASGMPLDSAWSGSSYDNHTNSWKGDPAGPNRTNFYPGTSSTDPNQGTLYKNQLLPRFKAAIADLEATGYTPVIKKFSWMQGEQDSKMELSAGRYAANLQRLRDRLAEDLELDAATDLPMVFGQVLPYSPPASRFAYRDLIRSQQASADMDSGSANAIPLAKMVATDSYSLKTDLVHYDTAGQLELGRDFAAAFTPARPNVLVVLVDDMGTEDTSVDFNYTSAGAAVDRVDPESFGFPAFSTDNRHFKTPQMEKLASQGMKFSRAYACQVCSPTRVTLMTGQNSSRHGTFQYIGGGGSLHNLQAPSNGSLKVNDRTLAEVFRDAGYRTIVAGKGHIGNHFNSNAGNYKTPASSENDYYGFQVNVSASSKGQQGSCYSNATSAFGLSTSGTEADFVAEYQDKTYNQIDPVTYPSDHPQANEPVFVTEAVTRELNERIEDSVAAGKPFFAYLSHYAVHDPHQPDPRFTANYPSLSGDVLDFATMIEGMDQGLGDTLEKLEELGVAENTLVVFLGDNGSDSKPRSSAMSMSNPLRGQKGNCYEGGIRIPMIVAWAKLDAANPHQLATPISPGSREHDIVSVQDLYPTLLSVAGLTTPTQDDNGDPLVIDGADLRPYLLGEAGSHRPQTLITHAPCSSRSSFFTTYHEDNWKLIYGYTHSSANTATSIPLGVYELYDLEADMHEANDLAAAQPEKVMQMARSMVAELERRGGGFYPSLKAFDSALDAIGMPSAAGDRHPVILPALAGVDTDQDQLDDNVEDPNRNGRVDAGETDPENANTDGDNVQDGEESKIGSDPLDATSYFKVDQQALEDGSFEILWKSAPGATFTLRKSTDLIDWNSIVASGVSASTGSVTRYNLGVPGEPKAFYSVELE